MDSCKKQADTELNLLVNTRTPGTNMNSARTRPHKYNQWVCLCLRFGHLADACEGPVIIYRVATSQLDLNSLTLSAHFSLTSRHRSDGYRVKSRAKRGKILHLQPLGFYKNMPRNQGPTLGHLSQIIYSADMMGILK